MNERILIPCPHCGARLFDALSKPYNADWREGATCAGCGAFLTGKELQQSAQKQKAALKSEVEAEFTEASKLPASYRSGRYQGGSGDRAISPDGEPHIGLETIEP
jgi:hypothetical protein